MDKIGRGKWTETEEEGKGIEGKAQRGRGAEIEEEGKAQRGRGAERWSHNIRTSIINHTASILCNYVYESVSVHKSVHILFCAKISRFMIHDSCSVTRMYILRQ